MSNLIWIIFIFLLAVLAGSLIWFIWRLRHFSQSNHHTVLDDKLLRNMLGDEALSKDLKNAMVNKSAGEPVSVDREHPPDSIEEMKKMPDQAERKQEEK
jgi:hypothetical protein